MRRCTTLLLFAGCGFSSPAAAPDGPGGPLIDAAAVDGANGGDAAVCVTGLVDVCGLPEPTMAFDIPAPATLDTGSDVRCKAVSVSGRELCLIYATEVTIAAGGTLTVTGRRPLALVSASTMAIAGAIDAGSHGAQIGPAADDASCGFATPPDMDAGGAGGGAGGSFTLAGGNGGVGDTDASIGLDGTGAGGTHGATAAAPALRGGCSGQNGGDELPGGSVGGAGGHAGGALYLAARQSVSVAGAIRATGAAGAGGAAQAGGGGGGAGGMIVIESPSITVGGQISANGGSGGQGGGRIVITGKVVDITGAAGSDGALGMTPAPGGFGANNNDGQFSAGGAGGAGTAVAGAGTGSILGGGGGGGAAGVIRLIGQPGLAGSTISPPPS